MGVKIIIDSTADIPSVTAPRFTVVPLTIRFGDEEFVDGVDIDRRQFYEKLIESDAMPSTSQANINDFERVFEKVVSDGDSAVVITLSSKLSGTYNSARIAASSYKDRIFVVDSTSVAIGAGILAELALKLADSGLTADKIATTLEHQKGNIVVIAMLDTLEYLKKGGRISSTAAIVGGLLSIKPVLTLRDGEIVMLGKARGSKQANNLLESEIIAGGGIDFSMPLLLGYTGLSSLLLEKYVADSAHLWAGHGEKLRSTMIGSVVGTHAGPGAIAVAYFKNS